MMYLRDYIAAALAGDFSEWRSGWEAFRQHAACLLRPHQLEHDDLPHGYEPPDYEPYCPRCDYDYDPQRRRSPWDFAPFSTATLLRYYDAREIVGWWIVERWYAFLNLVAPEAAEDEVRRPSSPDDRSIA
jgi:hypothetical protein